MKSSIDTERHPALSDLFPQGTGHLCQQAKHLLRSFAESRPTDFSFLQADDLRSAANSAFAGNPEWDGRHPEMRAGQWYRPTKLPLLHLSPSIELGMWVVCP